MQVTSLYTGWTGCVAADSGVGSGRGQLCNCVTVYLCITVKYGSRVAATFHTNFSPLFCFTRKLTFGMEALVNKTRTTS